MKNSRNFLLVALVAVFGLFVMNSCQKTDDLLQQGPGAQYAAVVDGGDVMINDGDVTLKSLPVLGGVMGHNFECYRKYITTSWEFVDGSEFLPGSAPALDWSTGAGLNRSPWYAQGTQVHVTYCPAVPMRFVTKAKNADGVITSLGMYDCTPDGTNFPITINGKRLGDKLILHTGALTSLPGYTNMHFEVTYTKNLIDVDATIKNSANDTQGEQWADYTCCPSSVSVTKSLAVGESVVYDGYDGTITGDITITIFVDNATITKTIKASTDYHPLNSTGLDVTLTTKKVGFYDSAVIGLSDSDVSMEVISSSID